MQFTTVALALFGAAASASASILVRQSPYPSCADSCLANADFSACAGPADFPCLCNNDAFIQGTTTCIQGACEGDDLAKAQAVAAEICLSVGVTLGPSPTGATPSGSAAPSGSGSAAPSGSTPITPSSAGASSASSSGDAPAPTGAASLNSASFFGLAAAGMVALAL